MPRRAVRLAVLPAVIAAVLVGVWLGWQGQSLGGAAAAATPAPASASGASSPRASASAATRTPTATALATHPAPSRAGPATPERTQLPAAPTPDIRCSVSEYHVADHGCWTEILYISGPDEATWSFHVLNQLVGIPPKPLRKTAPGTYKIQDDLVIFTRETPSCQAGLNFGFTPQQGVMFNQFFPTADGKFRYHRLWFRQVRGAWVPAEERILTLEADLPGKGDWVVTLDGERRLWNEAGEPTVDQATRTVTYRPDRLYPWIYYAERTEPDFFPQMLQPSVVDGRMLMIGLSEEASGLRGFPWRDALHPASPPPPAATEPPAAPATPPPAATPKAPKATPPPPAASPTPSPAIAWGDAVDGLQVGLTGGRVSGSNFGCLVHLRNVGREPLALNCPSLSVTEKRFGNQVLVFTPLGGGVPRRARRIDLKYNVPPKDVRITLQPGEATSREVQIRGTEVTHRHSIGGHWQFEDDSRFGLPGLAPAATREPEPSLDRLPPGRYSVRAELLGAEQGFWRGRASSGALEIEILPPGAAAATAKPPATKALE